MTATPDPGVFLEFYDDDVEIQEVSDTEFLEIYDGSFGMTVADEVLPFTRQGLLIPGAGTFRFPVKGGTFLIHTVSASLGTSGDAQIDVNKNGTTIYGTQSNRPTFTASNSAVVGVHSVTTVTDGDYFTIDIDSAANGAADLVVVIRLQRIA